MSRPNHFTNSSKVGSSSPNHLSRSQPDPVLLGLSSTFLSLCPHLLPTSVPPVLRTWDPVFCHLLSGGRKTIIWIPEVTIFIHYLFLTSYSFLNLLQLDLHRHHPTRAVVAKVTDDSTANHWISLPHYLASQLRAWVWGGSSLYPGGLGQFQAMNRKTQLCGMNPFQTFWLVYNKVLLAFVNTWIIKEFWQNEKSVTFITLSLRWGDRNGRDYLSSWALRDAPFHSEQRTSFGLQPTTTQGLPWQGDLSVEYFLVG